MPTYNVTLMDGGSLEQLKKVKEDFRKQGGTIQHEYSLIKGFTVDFERPDLQLESTDDYYVEKDTPVKAI